MKIPKPLLKEKKSIVNQYGIDRLSLNSAGIPEETIDRVYRCLFVYSTGFHQLLTKLMKHTEGKYRVIKNIWKTFAVLLEYWWKTDYDSLLKDIEKDYQEQQEETEHKFINEIEELKEEKQGLLHAINELEAVKTKLEREAFNQKLSKEKVDKEFALLRENIETEVKMRMEFEEKVHLRFMFCIAKQSPYPESGS